MGIRTVFNPLGGKQNQEIPQEETIKCGEQNTFAYSYVDVSGVRLRRNTSGTVKLYLTVNGTNAVTLANITDTFIRIGQTKTFNYSNIEVSIPAGSTIDLKISNTSYVTLTKTNVRITGKI